MHNGRTMRLTLSVTGIIILIFIIKIRWLGSSGDNWKETIHGDGKGHYHYLPATFINNGLRISINETPPGNFFSEADSMLVNRFFCGTAISISPFFLAAAGASKISGQPVDGYSLPFQCATSIAALFYFLAGLLFLWKLLRLYGISERWICAAVLLIAFGTNILYYVVYEPTMAHVYAFTYITVFFYLVKRISAGETSAWCIVFAFITFAMAILTRPVNVLVLIAVPFITGGIGSFKQTVIYVFSNKKAWVSGIMLSAALISIQLIYYYVQTGKIFVHSYSGAEGFDFTGPHIQGFLFSYRKGLFLYAPLLLFSLLGLIIVFRRNRSAFFSLALFLFVITYFLASMRNWYGGDSFGMRHMIDYYSLFAILLALVLSNTGRIAKMVIVSFCILCTFLNIIQSYQYAKYIFHPATMNKEKYWYIFLKTGEQYAGCLAGTDDTSKKELADAPIISVTSDMEHWAEGLSLPGLRAEKEAHSGSHVAQLDEALEYGTGITIHHRKMKRGDEPFVKASLWMYELEKNAAGKALLVMSIDSANGKNYSVEYFRISELPREEYKQWHEVRFNFHMPKLRGDNDIIKFYVWNPKKKRFWVDDLTIKIYLPIE